jgi:hypothetical protein
MCEQNYDDYAQLLDLILLKNREKNNIIMQIAILEEKRDNWENPPI